MRDKIKHKFVINGVGSAFLRIFGCSCNRCLTETEQVNCSASLLSFDEKDNTIHHVLFDIGEGVTQQLARSPALQGEQARLDWLCLTHWHPDHTKDINRLLASYIMAGKVIDGKERDKVKMWCRNGTADWMQKLHQYEVESFTHTHVSGEFLPPGHILSPIPMGVPGVLVTPFTVSHQNADMNAWQVREHRFCCAGFVIQSNSKKLVILWDIDSENGWLERPSTPAQKETVNLLTDADHIFVDCTFWKEKGKPTNHASFEHVMRYGRMLQPKNMWTVHITGHVEGIGNEGFGWTNKEWTQQAQRLWKKNSLPGQVAVPFVGQAFDL